MGRSTYPSVGRNVGSGLSKVRTLAVIESGVILPPQRKSARSRQIAPAGAASLRGGESMSDVSTPGEGDTEADKPSGDTPDEEAKPDEQPEQDGGDEGA